MTGTIRMTQSPIILSLPVWMDSFIDNYGLPLASGEDRMKFVVAMARENVQQKTGGPFAAAVFNMATGAMIAAGVNRVVPCACSIAHAEMMALALAQQKQGSYSLNSPGLPETELVTSVEPCAMCLGALPWSGIRRVVCGATDADARSAGFDEGVKPQNWISELEKRGITVVTGMCRDEAALVLNEYAETGGPVYNGTTRSV